MNGLQLSAAFHSDEMMKKYFYGCFMNKDVSTDLVRKNNGFFVLNTLEAIGGIGHWVLFFIDENRLYFFDSLGNEPEYYGGDIERLYRICKYRKSIVFAIPVQHPKSSVCGAYVLFFAYHMVRKKSVHKIKSYFTRFKGMNDRVVTRFTNKFLNIEKTCNHAFCQAYMFYENCAPYCKCKL